MVSQELLAILVLCLFAALALAYLANHVRTSALTAPADFKVGFGAFSLETGNAIVALYALSVLFGFGLPCYYFYVNRLPASPQIALQAQFDAQPRHVAVVHAEDWVNGSDLSINMPLTASRQSFLIEASEPFNVPMTISVQVIGTSAHVYLGTTEYAAIRIDHGNARLNKPLHLITRDEVAHLPTQAGSARIVNSPSIQKQVPTIFAHVGSPIGSTTNVPSGGEVVGK